MKESMAEIKDCIDECTMCHTLIYPGDSFYAAPHSNYPFCSMKCYAKWMGCRHVHCIDDDYERWFSKIKTGENNGKV